MPYKLLLADDSVTIQRVIELTFADEDVQVIAVGDGKQAIERLQADHPDIVLADVGMPERDGYEVAAFVKGHPQFAHIPVLLLTGAFEPIDEARAKAVGCDGVLVKPFEPQMVINRVKDLLAGRRSAGAGAGSPVASAPIDQPAEVGVRPSSLEAPPASPAGSLEDYFDRLDAAFASLDGGIEPPMPAPAPEPMKVSASPVDEAPLPRAEVSPIDGPTDVLAGWDPELQGDPTRPAPAGPFVPEHPRAAASPRRDVVVPRPVASQPSVPPPAPAPNPEPQVPGFGAEAPASLIPHLADAFGALLAAEQAQPVPAVQSRAAVTDEMIEDIVRRVVNRMGDQAVRATVVDVAERLVREEIQRIKSASV